MDKIHMVLVTMDVIMLLWLSRLGIGYRVMHKDWGGWWFALYACVMLAGVGYFIWFLPEWCEGGC